MKERNFMGPAKGLFFVNILSLVIKKGFRQENNDPGPFCAKQTYTSEEFQNDHYKRRLQYLPEKCMDYKPGADGCIMSHSSSSQDERFWPPR